MSHSYVCLAAAVAATLCASSTRAHAPTPTESTDPTLWRPVTSGPFTALTAPISPHRRLTLQPLAFANLVRGSFDAEGEEVTLPDDETFTSIVGQLFVEYGLLPSLALGAQSEVVYNRARVGAQRASHTGLGETLLFARWALPIEPGRWTPDVTLIASMKIPTGRAEGFDPGRLGTDAHGNGSWEPLAGVSATFYWKPVVWHADALAAAPLSARIDGVRTRPGPAFFWALAAEVPLFGDRFAFMAEASGAFQGSTVEDGVTAPQSRAREVSLAAGLEWIISEDVQLLAGYRRTLLGANVAALDTLGITLVPVL